jgi:hypothetical protein
MEGLLQYSLLMWGQQVHERTVRDCSTPVPICADVVDSAAPYHPHHSRDGGARSIAIASFTYAAQQEDLWQQLADTGITERQLPLIAVDMTGAGAPQAPRKTRLGRGARPQYTGGFF